MLRRVLRLAFPVDDSIEELLFAAAFFVGYAVVDRATRSLARYEEAAAGSFLFFSALGSNLPLTVLAVVISVVGVVRLRGPLLARWTDLDHGRELRWLALPCLALMTWQASFHRYNYVLDRVHLWDRLLAVALAAAAVRRPVFLIPFVLQARVVAHQFALPFGTTAGQNIDDLLLVVLAVLAGAHLVVAVTGRDDTAPALLVVTAALTAAFFVPGRGKLLLNWLAHEDLTNLASSGYAIGWLGQTDGGLATTVAGLMAAVGLPLRVALLAFELGAGVVAVNHRWFRWWLPVTVLFHIANFLLLGFWFLTWVALEVALIVLLHRRSAQIWLERNRSVGRAALTGFAVVILGPLLFHPAGLAWLDSPVAYGYQVEVVGESGRRYRVDLNHFEPFAQELAFTRLQAGPTRPATGSYGVVVSTERLDQFAALSSVEQVSELEVPYGPEASEDHRRSERFLRQFVDYANRRAAGDNPAASVLGLLGPLPKFWTGVAEPTYRFDEPIRLLELHRLTSLRLRHDDGTQEFQHLRIRALTLEG